MLRNTFLNLVICFLLSGAASAADFKLRENLPSSECMFDLTGPIQTGDFENIQYLTKELIDQHRERESTAALVVCLNSPGGSVYEGLKIAEYFRDNGLGTRLEKDAVCYSMCAIIFMMGNAAGPEVNFINRAMHYTAELGFHRPYISLQDANDFSADDVEAAYDFGIEAIFGFTQLGNKPRPNSRQSFIPSDLMVEIIGTRGEDLFFIETVEHAARWDIGIIDLPLQRPNDALAAYFTCENALKWEVSRHPNPQDLFVSHAKLHSIPDQILTYEFADQYPVLSSVTPGPLYDAGGVRDFRVNSIRNGYHSVSCRIILQDSSEKICAFDMASGVKYGDGICENVSLDERDSWKFIDWVPSQLLKYPPDMPLKNFSLFEFLDEYRSIDLARCIVIYGNNKQVDNEPCIMRVKFERDSGSETYLRSINFTWPSGSTSHLEIEYAYDPSANYDAEVERSFTINGTRSELIQRRGANCFPNAKTGNLFCFVSSQGRILPQ